MEGVLEGEEHDAPVIVPFPDMEFIFRVTGGKIEPRYVDVNYTTTSDVKGLQAIRNVNQMFENKKLVGNKMDFSGYPEYVEEETKVVKREAVELNFDYIEDYIKKKGIKWSL